MKSPYCHSLYPHNGRGASKKANGRLRNCSNVVLDNDYIESLKQVIFHLHKADSIWVESVPVREVSHGCVIWEGPVEVFTLRNHPRTKRAYAWCQPDGPKDERTRFVAELEIPPVVSPETAVKLAIAAEVKGKK